MQESVSIKLYIDYALSAFVLECEKTGVDFVKLEYLVPADALKTTQTQLAW